MPAPGNEPALALPARTNVYDLHEFVVILTFGSASIASYWGKDIFDVRRNSAGNYTIELPRPYGRLYKFEANSLDASGAVLFPVLVSQTLSTDGKVVIELRTEAGTATDATSGDQLFVILGVSYNALNDAYSGRAPSA